MRNQQVPQPCSNLGASLSTALILANLVAASRHLSRPAGEGLIAMLRAASFTLAFLLLAAASVHAQDADSSFLTWLHHVGRTGAHHRAAASPPLPRPRPAELAQRPAELAPATVTPHQTSAHIPD
jgi:hypothetical protein